MNIELIRAALEVAKEEFYEQAHSGGNPEDTSYDSNCAPEYRLAKAALLELDKVQVRLSEWQKFAETVRNICNAPHWTAVRRWTIHGKAESAIKGVFVT